MRIAILNGAEEAGAVDELAIVLERRFQGPGSQVRSFYLRDLAVGHCLGEFDCWVRTPGRCRIHDEGQEIERAVHHADLLVFLSPVTFGGYGPQLKKAVDRLIPLILPFFEKRADLTHHQHRYASLPRILGVGWDPIPTPERQRLFRALVESNALNLGLPGWSAAIVGDDRSTWEECIASALDAPMEPGNASGSLEGARSELGDATRASRASDGFGAAPRVAILQASARAPGTSTSESLARYLSEQFALHETHATMVSATSFARDAATAHAAAELLANADVVVVVAPLYVDSLPYLATLALTQVCTLRKTGQGKRPARLVGIVNCGFPEPEQTRFAFGVLREFAREANYVWGGGFAVGGGEAIHGRPLASTGGMTKRLRASLDEAAAALARGGVAPEAASDAVARPFLPPPLYRLVGWTGWWRHARSHGRRLGELRVRPFDDISDEEWERVAMAGSARARPLRVIGKIAETEDAVTVLFEDPAHHPLRYEAGQHLTLELIIDGERARRAYSLSSAPCEAGLSITVKRVAGGLVSNFVHDRLAIGDLVRCYGPSGRFTAGPAPERGQRALLLIAGGSGIVPLAAIARHTLTTEAAAHVTLIYGSSTLERTIFGSALGDLAERYEDRLRLELVLEQPPPEWQRRRGRLDESGLGPILDELELGTLDRVLVCGPDPMRLATRTALGRRGVPAARIFEESFTSPRRASVPEEPQVATMVQPDGATRLIRVIPGQTLLEAALDAGEAISFSCLSGGCGACHVRILESRENVVLDAPNDVTPEERARGEVPSCLVRLAGPIRFQTSP